MRCPTPFQDVYRELAARHGAILVDGQAVFHSRHPRGLLDDSLFNDGMHPSFEGYVALAEATLGELKRRGAFGWPSSLAAPRIDLAECAGHFDITTATWKEVCKFAAGFYRTTAPDPPRSRRAQRQGEALRGRPCAGSKPASRGIARHRRDRSPAGPAAGCHQAIRVRSGLPSIPKTSRLALWDFGACVRA